MAMYLPFGNGRIILDESKLIRVAPADDHAVVRKGIREFLKEARDVQVVAEATTGSLFDTRCLQLRACSPRW